MPFYINDQRMREMEKRLGCTFSDEGEFAEMALSLADYREKTHPIVGTTKSVSHQSANAWIDYFFTCMGIGFDVQTALDEANTFMAESYGAVDSAFCECVFVGDSSFVLP